MKTYLIRHSLNGKEIKSFVVQGYDTALQQLREWYARDIYAEDNICFRTFGKHSFRVANVDNHYYGLLVRLKNFES